MPEHQLNIDQMPEVEILNKDLKISVKAAGNLLGTLTVSRGGLGWYPSKGKQERLLDWEQFDRLIRREFNDG